MWAPSVVPGFSTLNTPPRWNSSSGGCLPETTQAVKEPLVSLDDSLVRSSGLPWQPPVSTGREGPQLLAALVPLPSIQWGQGGTHRPGHILAKGAPDRLGVPRKACLSKKTSGKVLLLADPPGPQPTREYQPGLRARMKSMLRWRSAPLQASRQSQAHGPHAPASRPGLFVPVT